jgi:hypothetical protein
LSTYQVAEAVLSTFQALKFSSVPTMKLERYFWCSSSFCKWGNQGKSTEAACSRPRATEWCVSSTRELRTTAWQHEEVLRPQSNWWSHKWASRASQLPGKEGRSGEGFMKEVLHPPSLEFILPLLSGTFRLCFHLTDLHSAYTGFIISQFSLNFDIPAVTMNYAR